jgi:hypothetical protein
MQTDYLQFIFQAINNLLTQNLGFFDAMGRKSVSDIRDHSRRLVWHQVRAFRLQWQRRLPL